MSCFKNHLVLNIYFEKRLVLNTYLLKDGVILSDFNSSLVQLCLSENKSAGIFPVSCNQLCLMYGHQRCEFVLEAQKWRSLNQVRSFGL